MSVIETINKQDYYLIAEIGVNYYDIATKLGISNMEAAKLMVDVKTKEARIETEYFEKFAKILDSRQLFLLKRAETRFSRNMLQHHKEASRRTR